MLYINVRRWNIDYLGIPDFPYNIFLHMIGKATLLALMVVPMTCLLMKVIPKNIEASMFALVTGILKFSTDWAGDMIGGIYCNIFGVTTDNLSEFHWVIITKICTIVLGLILTQFLLPKNSEIMDLKKKLDNGDNESEEE